MGGMFTFWSKHLFVKSAPCVPFTHQPKFQNKLYQIHKQLTKSQKISSVFSSTKSMYINKKQNFRQLFFY